MTPEEKEFYDWINDIVVDADFACCQRLEDSLTEGQKDAIENVLTIELKKLWEIKKHNNKER